MPTRPSSTAAAEQLVRSYARHGATNTIGTDLPSRADVVRILNDVEELIFPGFRETVLEDRSLAEVTTARCEQLTEHARVQVFKDLCFAARSPEQGPEACGEDSSVGEQANDIACELARSLPDLRSMLLYDVEALLDGDPAAQSKEEIILAYPGLRAILAYRVAHFFWQRGARLIARIMSEATHATTGVDIHPGAQIGKHFHIDHGTGVVIGETTVIGDNVKLYQGVSLGALSVSRKKFGEKRHPTIEDHVTIYAGATILGGETVVGHHSIVGGNVWLVRSVPSYSVVENDPRVHVRTKAERRPETWFYEI